MEKFVHLHVHTYYSLLDGQSSIEAIVNKAISDGMPGVAITDHGNMFGVKELYNYCKKVNKKRKEQGLEPFKPIFGCEVYVARRGMHNKTERIDQRGNHLILLAKNATGYKNLIKLVSRSWVDGRYYTPRTDHDDIRKYHEGLICCSACIAGEVPALILKDDIKGACKALEFYKDVFGDDYYLELQRHEVKDPMQRANRETFPLQEKANKVLIELAKKYDVKLVCTNDAHFVNKENAEAHDHLLCINSGKDLDDPERLLYSKQEWFKTTAEMNEIFSDVPEAMSNTVKILDQVELYDIDHSPIMPFFRIPEEFGTEEQYRQRITEKDLFDEFTTDENGENPLPQDEAEKKIKRLGGYEKLYRIKLEADYLAKLSYDGAKRLYGDPIPPETAERIKFELHIMKTMGFPGYFLIVQDFINSARKELGVMVGPGRGSAAGSVVAYCLGITKIEPMKYDLLFERFLNPDRISLPDLDTDFDDDGRNRVLDWVKDKYGHDNVAHIVTYGTMATKNSFKDVARVEKMPYTEANELCKLFPERLPDGVKMNLGNVVKHVPELQNYSSPTTSNEKQRKILEYAQMLEGTVRGTGIHACGVIICRDRIDEWVPVCTAEDKENRDENGNSKLLLATQYDGHVIEETGLIKMDFLGLKTLSILKDAVENVKFSHGVDIDLDNIPIDDELTYRLYQEGRTVGTFQFESAGMQKYLRELKPTVFEDLIAMNALYRPGPMDNIPDFIARKKDPSKITYDIPCMEKYLADTYGITVYQEQVMLLSRQLADFTRGESDALRKAMGKKKKDIVDQMKPKFIEGGIKNGHPENTLNKIWSEWEKFASYAFNKSHATCYSWVAYQTAYMKAHYPAEYMAAVLSRNISDIDKLSKFMDECKAMKIKVKGPDVNESFTHFSANKTGDIRFGLAGIKGIGTKVVEGIINERLENGLYTDLFDFVKRVCVPSIDNKVTINRKALETLAQAGAFDCFPEVNREDFFVETRPGETFADQLIRFGQEFKFAQINAQNSLFGDEGLDLIEPPKIVHGDPWSNMELLRREKELVGMYLSAQPLDPYIIELEYGCNTRLADFAEITPNDERVLTFGGVVVDYQERTTKKNAQKFGILKIEDYTGSYELRLFGDSLVKYKAYGVVGTLVFVRGQYKKRLYGDNSDFIINDIKLLETVKGTLIDKIKITVNERIPLEFAEMLSKYKVTTEQEASLKADENQDSICELRVVLQDFQNDLSVETVSPFKVRVNKSLLDYLNETNVTFKITRSHV